MMTFWTESAVEVPKEGILDLRFPDVEVLDSASEKRERSQKIHRATSLGNLEKHKVKIYFQDGEGVRMTHTTIWAQTDKKILLKDGAYIPVHRILDIELK